MRRGKTRTLGGMKRVAVFGNAGGGKSTLARELAAITGLPLAVVDELQYRAGGAQGPARGVSSGARDTPRQRRMDHRWIWRHQVAVGKARSGGYASFTLTCRCAAHLLWVTKRLDQGSVCGPAEAGRRAVRSPAVRSQAIGVLWPCRDPSDTQVSAPTIRRRRSASVSFTCAPGGSWCSSSSR